MDGGQVTVFGKGSKTRVVLLPNTIWRELLRLRNHADHVRQSSRPAAAVAICIRGAPIHLVQATLGHASVGHHGALPARPADRLELEVPGGLDEWACSLVNLLRHSRSGLVARAIPTMPGR
jgi:hypothetical protein